MTVTITIPQPNLVGVLFQSPRHASPVPWKVLYYHRGDAWVCEDQEHFTTCEFYLKEILDALFKQHIPGSVVLEATTQEDPS